MEGGTAELLWQSEPEAESIISMMLARAMSALICARPRKLQDAIFRLSSLTQRPSVGSLEDSLWFLHKYVSDAAEKEDPCDQVLVPMIENYYMDKNSSEHADEKDSEVETRRSKDDKCLEEVLKRLSSENISQRRNAIDVISEVIDISTDSQKSSLLSAWKDVANNLLERLGDEDIVIREQASKLLPSLATSAKA